MIAARVTIPPHREYHGGYAGSATGGTGGTGTGGAGTGGAGTGGTGTGGAAGIGGGGAPPAGDYEGYGSITRGHESCPTAPSEYHVTSLDDAGPGTLRDGLSEGCRHIVFDRRTRLPEPPRTGAPGSRV